LWGHPQEGPGLHVALMASLTLQSQRWARRHCSWPNVSTRTHYRRSKQVLPSTG